MIVWETSSDSLTNGEWVVHGVEGVDERTGWIYYSSNHTSVLGHDLHRVRKDGTKSERITVSTGTHDIKLNPKATAAVDFFLFDDPNAGNPRAGPGLGEGNRSYFEPT